VHRDLVLVRRWTIERDRELMSLFGGLTPNGARQALIVISLCEFGVGRRHEIKFFQTECRHLASPTAIRDEVHSLVSQGLFLVCPSPDDRRRTVVCPTKHLVTLASEIVPRLQTTALRIFAVGSEALPCGSPK
jgi:hypothetical protein